MDQPKRRWLVTGMSREDGKSKQVYIMARSADQAIRAAMKLGIEQARATLDLNPNPPAPLASADDDAPAARLLNLEVQLAWREWGMRLWSFTPLLIIIPVSLLVTDSIRFAVARSYLRSALSSGLSSTPSLSRSSAPASPSTTQKLVHGELAPGIELEGVTMSPLGDQWIETVLRLNNTTGEPCRGKIAITFRDEKRNVVLTGDARYVALDEGRSAPVISTRVPDALIGQIHEVEMVSWEPR